MRSPPSSPRRCRCRIAAWSPAEVLAAVQAAEACSDPQEALARLASYGGKPSALIPLLQGQALFTLAGRDSPAPGAQHLAQAEAAFRSAASLDPQLRQARLGLAEVAAARGDWKQALGLAGAALDPTRAAELEAYGAYACRAQDWELASSIVSLGMLRFPLEPGMRQLNVTVLVHGRRFAEAAQALQARLDADPGQAGWWRDLAYCLQELGDAERSLCALEAASILAPQDRELRQQLCLAQLQQGQPAAALATVQALLGSPLSKTEPATLILAARIALAAGDLRAAGTDLAQLGMQQRTIESARLAAKIALDAGDQAGAAAAISDLIRLGEHDPGVLAWAAGTAERQGASARAEALYRQAMAGDGPQAESAQLRLAVLLDRESRTEEAQGLVAAYLARHPGDRDAASLQSLITAHRAEQAPAGTVVPARPPPP